jgi:hypothetical protein
MKTPFLLLALTPALVGTVHAAPPVPVPPPPALVKPLPPPNYARYYPNGNMSLPPIAVLTGQLGYKSMMTQQAEKQAAQLRALASAQTNLPSANVGALQPDIVVEVIGFGDDVK